MASRFTTTRLIFAAVVLAFAIHSPAAPATWVVSPDGSGDFVRIMDAVQAAGAMDTIRVLPGTYHGSVELGGEALALIGQGGAEATVVDADGAGSALAIPFTPGGPFLIRGFTFTNGNGTLSRSAGRDERCGGGVFTELAFGRIEDCRIVGNVANSGGGVYVIAGAPEFVRCTISGNSSGVGGGVSVDNDGGVLLRECTIAGNDAVFGGGIQAFRGGLILEGSSVVGNRAYLGGAVRIVDAGEGSVRILGSLIARNTADVAGAVHCWYGALEVESTTIAGNDSIPSVGVVLEQSTVSVVSTIVAGNGAGRLITCVGGRTSLDCVVLWPPQPDGGPCFAEGGVLFDDPRFCDTVRDDYSLRPDSPCLPGQGPPGCGRIGRFGIGCQIPVSVRPGSWGEIKALFR